MLLGGSAIGQTAIGQGSGALVITLIKGSYTSTGFPATFKITAALAAGAYLETGSAATFKIMEAVAAGAYALTGFNANEIVFEVTGAGAYISTGFDAHFYRDFVNWVPATEPKASAWQGAGILSPGWTVLSPASSKWTIDGNMSIPPPERV